MLRDNACKSEKTMVKRPYTADEIKQYKEVLAADMVELNKEQEELKKVQDEIKAKMKPLQVRVKEATSAIRNGSYENREEVFMLDDQARGIMDVYDSQGKFLYSRRLFEDERQTNIMSMMGDKTGTD